MTQSCYGKKTDDVRSYCGCQHLRSHLKTTTQSKMLNKMHTLPPQPKKQHAMEKKSDSIESVLHEAKLMRSQHNHSVVVGVLSQNHQMKSSAMFKKYPGD